MTGGWVETIANLNVRSVVAIAFVLTLLRWGMCFSTNPYARWVAELFESAAMACVIVFMVIRPFAVQSFYIPSESMVPTLQVNDRIMVDKMSYRFRNPKVDEVVVFKAPVEADPNEVEFIKRCVGVAGDVIDVHGGKLYRNGKAITETFIAQNPDYDMKIVNGKIYRTDPYDSGVYLNRTPLTDPNEINYIIAAKPAAVPAGCILMLGDNRNNSNDGHMWGFVPLERVVGRAWLLYWPVQRVRTVK